ncbi:MAG: LuxR C-terminal-related transcriptional regulator [Acidimicrobiia bacterium]
MIERGEAQCRAIVADDVALLRLGVTAVLEPLGIDVVAQTHVARDIPGLCSAHGAELVVVGQLSDASPAEVMQRVRALSGSPMVLALLPRTHREELAALMALDINGLVVRSVQPEELALSIERVRKGERVIAPALLSTLVGSVSIPEVADDDELVLTRREREVLALLAEGRSNRELADALFVTLATVKTHLAHVYTKLGAKNRNEAISRAVALGLLG